MLREDRITLERVQHYSHQNEDYLHSLILCTVLASSFAQSRLLHSLTFVLVVIVLFSYRSLRGVLSNNSSKNEGAETKMNYGKQQVLMKNAWELIPIFLYVYSKSPFRVSRF